MKLGAFDPLFSSLDLETMLDKSVDLGLEAVELSPGGFVDSNRCDPTRLLADDAARTSFKGVFERHGLTISALLCHGNPLHPDEAVSRPHHDAWRSTVKLAQKLGVEVVVTFSGCPGGGPDDRVPNWHVCAWPTDHTTSLE